MGHTARCRLVRLVPFGGLKLNDRGDVTGYGQSPQASIWFGGQFVAIPPLPGGESTKVDDIDTTGTWSAQPRSAVRPTR